MADPTRGAASPPTPRAEAGQALLRAGRQSVGGPSWKVDADLPGLILAIESEARGAVPLDVAYSQAKLVDQHDHSQQYIEEAFIEAARRARLSEGPIPQQEPEE